VLGSVGRFHSIEVPIEMIREGVVGSGRAPSDRVVSLVGSRVLNTE
jgi:hypothetical protein